MEVCNRVTIGFAVLALAAAAPAASQGVVAIEGARIYTVSGPVIENGTVLIRGDRIVAVGNDIAVPADARRIDARGSVVTPGFIESKTNLGLAEVGLAPATQDFVRVAADNIAAAFNVSDGLNPNSVVLPVTRLSGVTTAVTQPGIAGISAPGGPVHIVSGQGAIIDLTESSVEAMIVRSPVAMFGAIGEAAEDAAGGARGGVTQRLRELLTDTRLYRDRRNDYDRGNLRQLSASRADLEAMIPVVDGRLPLVIMANRASDIRVALKLAREFGLRIVISGAAEGWMVAGDLAAADVPVITKVLASMPATFAQLGARFDNAALMRAAGVRVALSTEDTHNARNLRFEAGNAVTHGMPWDEALRAVTLTPAEVWGISDTHGSIRPGRVANLVVWDGDPFEFMTQATHVFVQGREVPRTSREIELRDRYRARPTS